MEVEIGRGKKGRRAYGFDDIAIVPSRRTRDPDDIDITWTLGPYRFELPLLASAMDGVVSPGTAGAIGKLGGLAVLNLEGIFSRYDYSIWNEPNGRDFLRADEDDLTVVGADLYRDLYVQGRAAVKAANPDANVMIGELSYLGFKPARWAPGGNLIRGGVDAHQFLRRVASSPLETDGVAWHPYQHVPPPNSRGFKGKAGIGKVDITQREINGLFNKRAPCTSGLYRQKIAGGACERPALLYTEFGYLARHPIAERVHSERVRAGRFKKALKRALDNNVKWMSIYNVTESDEPSTRTPKAADFGVFATNGAVRGKRLTNDGKTEDRKAYCDGIRQFALANGYPRFGAEAPPC